MGLIITTSDFENGRYKISLSPEQEVDLDLYITSVEDKYLPMLFGSDLYELFKIDWNTAPVGIPTDQRFKNVFDEFTQQNDCVMLQSDGIEEMLKGFIYYLYLRDTVSRPTTIGIEKFIGENTEFASAIQHDLTSMYNEAVDTFKTIQYYMNDFDADTYPEFKGVDVSFANIF